MMAEREGPVTAFAAAGIEQLRLAVIDHDEPSPGQLERAVAFIQRHSKDGNKVLVHCKAGHGRSAAVAFAWLLHQNPKASLVAIQAHLSHRRKVRKALFKQKSVVTFAVQHRSQMELKESKGSDSCSSGALDRTASGSSIKVPIFAAKWKSLLFAVISAGMYLGIVAKCVIFWAMELAVLAREWFAATPQVLV